MPGGVARHHTSARALPPSAVHLAAQTRPLPRAVHMFHPAGTRALGGLIPGLCERWLSSGARHVDLGLNSVAVFIHSYLAQGSPLGTPRCARACCTARD